MSWGKKKEEDPLDKMSNEMLKVNKCTECSYVPKNFTDYVKHLEKKHPEGGKATGW